MEELVVLVDNQGSVVGSANKSEVHGAHTPLHLAFSCYIFNDKGQFLLTKRAHAKKVWPSVWTNSVCGHPMPGETSLKAIARRAKFELGLSKVSKPAVMLADYRYKTPPFNGIIENEVCPVFVAVTHGRPVPNPLEVEDYKWIDWKALPSIIKAEPSVYSWWLKDQLKLLQKSAGFKDFLKSF